MHKQGNEIECRGELRQKKNNNYIFLFKRKENQAFLNLDCISFRLQHFILHHLYCDFENPSLWEIILVDTVNPIGNLKQWKSLDRLCC